MTSVTHVNGDPTDSRAENVRTNPRSDYNPYAYAHEALRVLYRRLGAAAGLYSRVERTYGTPEPVGRLAQMTIEVPAPCPDCGGFHDADGNPIET